MPIRVHLDDLLTQRGISLTELSQRVGITLVNLSILKNNRARAVRFSTLDALCRELACQPGDLFSFEAEPDEPATAGAATGGDGGGAGRGDGDGADGRNSAQPNVRPG